jgi:hypothetical protein
MALRGGMAVGALEHVDQVVIGIDAVQPAGHYQAAQGGDRLGADLAPAGKTFAGVR